MILVDFNLVCIQTITAWCILHQNIVLDDARALLLIKERLEHLENSFRTFGKMVLCCDSRSYWRKAVFPGYKFKRKQSRLSTSSTLKNMDWKIVHGAIDIFKKKNRFQTIEVEGAEADDVIAVLTQQFHSKENIVIMSADRDFYQLQRYNTFHKKPVLQFNGKAWLEDPDWKTNLKEKIIRGDPGDSIPNFMSADDVYMLGQRVRRLNTPKVEEWLLKDDYHDFCDTPEKVNGYERNRLLIDFEYIPTDLKASILTEYGNTLNG